MKQPKRSHFSLRKKINSLVFLNTAFVLIMVMACFSYIIIQREFQEKGKVALHLAKTVADLPIVRVAFHDPNPATIIAPYIEKMRVDTEAQFIVIGNMNLIRYSHPNPEQIGKRMVGEDDDLVLRGEESISEAVGTLGLSIRGKSPIYDDNHQQIGVVSVGFLVEDIWKQIFRLLLQFASISLVALAFGLIGAHLLSGHIKRQIFNMEPEEIALLTQQQSVILESIREGIIAVDSEGTIITCNQEAKKTNGWENMNPIGKQITSLLPNSRLPDVLKEGKAHFDQPMLVGDSLVITNRAPLFIQDKIIGAVSTFRDKVQLDQIDQRLADIGNYVDTLRSQRHEFMNKLHLISGLIKMKDYHSAKELIENVNDEQQTVLDFFLAHIRDPAIVGILLGKLHRAKELGITLQVRKDSRLKETGKARELIITFLGNGIENAFEAIAGESHSETKPRKVEVYINDASEHFLLSVEDSGPGVDPQLGDRIFEDGISTKGQGRGLGLALLQRLVANVGGSIAMHSSSRGSTLKAVIPK